MAKDWFFEDDPLTACFTTKSVLGGAPIVRVVHDFDGDWQFHGEDGDPDAVLVALEVIVKGDPSINQLHDLPYGWGAERNTPSTPWMRFKNNEYPEFSERGFYLEDAVWVASYRDDLDLPSEDDVLQLEMGNYVKLLFRFADEAAEREDHEVERMWVEIVGFDDYGDFVGTIANDPVHEVAKFGDVVHFHSRHIADIGNFD